MKLRTPNIKQFILFYILFSILTLNIFATQYKTYNEVNTKESLPTSNTWIISTDDDAGTGGDAGDFYYNATEIIPGFYNASLHDDADIDFYTFYVRKGQIINITIQSYNLSMNFDMYLLSPEVVVLDSDLKDAGLSENIIRSTQNGGNFYAKIETAVSDNFGNYSLYLEILSQNDFNTNNDAGNVFNDPLSIQNGNSSGTLVKNSDTNDFYSISIQKGEILDIFMESTNTTNIDLSLYDVENNLLAESNRIIGFNESIIYSFSQEGIFIIHLALVEETSSKIIIPYNLTIISTIQNDANSNTDAGNNPEDAYLIIPLTNSRFVGKLVSFGDLADYYVFNIQEKNIIYTSLEVPDNANL
ncbi:MAG: hypothetical protein U9O98_06810, partial [Asgard group archaeon]|nr:hypothetical protein [Asgard group archaeon]